MMSETEKNNRYLWGKYSMHDIFVRNRNTTPPMGQSTTIQIFAIQQVFSLSINVRQQQS